jgi:8-oxo-dGTP pyrophosphatase MutT (NUDIX family)
MDWKGEGNPWRVRATRTAYENPWLAIEENDVVHPNGADGFYGVVRIRKLAVGALPVDDDGFVYLVGQWRFPLGRYSWEMPEGGAEPGEDPEICARRELAEETGLRAGRLEQILRMDVSNSVTDEQAVIFLATELEEGIAAPEPSESLKVVRAPLEEALARAVDGRISDALTVAALLRAHHMAVQGVGPPALARALKK